MMQLVWDGATSTERVIAASLLLVVVGAAAVGFWPSRLPGPILREETEGRRASHSALISLLLAVASLTALGALVLRIEPRETWLLVSRTRTSPFQCVTTWPQPSSPGSEVCNIAGRDLGDRVDQALQRADGARKTSPAPKAVNATTLAAMVPQPSPNTALEVNGTEVAQVLDLADRGKLGRLIVVPGPTSDVSHWRLLGTVLEDMGVATELVDEIRIPPGLSVTKLSNLVLHDDGMLGGSALVVGQLPEVTTLSFQVVEADGTVRAKLQQNVRADEVDRRQVRLQLACPTCSTRGSPTLLLQARRNEQTTAVERIVSYEDTKVLRLTTASRTPLAKLLTHIAAPAFVDSEVGRSLADELDGLGLPWPKLVKESGDRVLVMTSTTHAIAIATPGNERAATEWLSTHSQEILNGPTRLQNNAMGRSTTFSYENLALLEPRAALPPEGSLLRGVSQSESASLGIVHTGPGWVVMNVPVPQSSDWQDSLSTLPFLRTLAWAGIQAASNVDAPRSLQDTTPVFAELLTTAKERRDIRENERAPYFSILLLLGGLLITTSLLRLRRARRLATS